MYYSPHSNVQLVDPDRVYIQLNQTAWSWVKFTNNLDFTKVGGVEVPFFHTNFSFLLLLPKILYFCEILEEVHMVVFG